MKTYVLRFALAQYDMDSLCGGGEYEAQVASFAFGVVDAMLRDMNSIE